ncbi:MAG: hypothetical protein HYU58_09090 [Proteobacteria bacterium]|nr:hypothetical protein [Pseudomonadota bacterium]
MRLLFSASVPKYSDAPDQNEDCADADVYRGIYAISDGASESYNSQLWAQLLVASFLKSPAVSSDWIRAAADGYRSQFDRDSLSWSAQAAFDRGSFATLTGVRVIGDRVRLLGIGDSIAVLTDGSRVCCSFPYTNAEQFKAHPRLLSTVHERNEALVAVGSIGRLTTDWFLGGIRKPTILMMTDALGAWLLKRPERRLERLLEVPSQIAFANLVEAERRSGEMRRDDSTLLRIG